MRGQGKREGGKEREEAGEGGGRGGRKGEGGGRGGREGEGRGRREGGRKEREEGGKLDSLTSNFNCHLRSTSDGYTFTVALDKV